MTTRRRRLADGGFTLIELLVSIVILGILAFPLANVIINYLLNSSSTTSRLGESADAQIAAAYWQQDVASMGVRGAYDSGTQTFPFQQSVNTSFPCSAGGASPLITLAWNQYDTSGNATVYTVLYGTKNSGTTLVRSLCKGSTLSGTSTLMRHLSGAPTCDFGSGNVACSSYTSATPPATIALNLHVSSGGSGQPFDITLNGQRRQT